MVALLFSRSERDGLWKQLYYGRLAERMEALCKQAGYHLLVLGMDAERPSPEIIRQREVDGVLLAGVKKEAFGMYRSTSRSEFRSSCWITISTIRYFTRS
ncbi:hypothetical protein HMSSN139_37630 [Paenibacillus sp. HMSSN-139]|nr:hypothetical protein HMSSN139_37630 [Paenibacillus sp. HMSSN-139]